MIKRAILTSIVLLLAVVGLLPLLMMFAESLLVEGQLSFVNYQGLLASGRSWTLLGRSLELAALTVVLATVVGVPLGVLLGKTDLPGRGFFTLLFTIPLLVPPYITAVSWFDVLGRQGFLSRFVGTKAAEWTSAKLFGLPGCVLVLFSTFLPILMLLTIAFLRTVNPRLEEAGRLISGWAGVLKGITIPLILPGILLAATLVFLLSLGDLGVPMFLRYEVFPVESFTQFSAFFNFGAATAASVPLAVITLLALGVEWVLLHERFPPIQPVSKEEVTEIRLGPARIGILCGVALLCGLLVILPFSGLVVQSSSLTNYADAWSRAADSLLRSLAYAALGASLLTVFGFFVGYIIDTRALGLWRSVDAMTLFLFALPGTVIGIGLVSLWNRPSTRFIYGTPIIILLGYLAQYTALASRVVVATLSQIPRSMEEAAQLVGAGWIRRVAWIVVPLCGRGLLAAWLVAYIFCLRDLSISILVYPPGRDTFPVRTFTLMANGPPQLIAALCVILVVATLAPLGALAFLSKPGGVLHGVH